MEPFEKEIFTRTVYEIVGMIPPGRATSYGAIAKAANYPNMSRMVGKIMSECPQNLPAHRVVSSSGYLSAEESFGNVGEMQELLESEGVAISHHRIKNWKKVFWDPIKEINL